MQPQGHRSIQIKTGPPSWSFNVSYHTDQSYFGGFFGGILDGQCEDFKVYEFLATSNAAEMYGLYRVLLWLLANQDFINLFDKVSICYDSQFSAKVTC